MQAAGIGIATAGLLMICGTVGYDFSVGAFAVIDDLPDQFRDRQSVAASGAGRADVRPVRLAVPDARPFRWSR